MSNQILFVVAIALTLLFTIAKPPAPIRDRRWARHAWGVFRYVLLFSAMRLIVSGFLDTGPMWRDVLIVGGCTFFLQMAESIADRFRRA